MSSQTQDQTQDLFEAAKLDGPSDLAREAMWASIQGATAAGSVTSLATMKATGLASSKLALGIALGATLTVGIAATVIALTRPASMSAPRSAERMAPRALEHVTRNVEAPPPVIVTGHVAQAPQAPLELDQKPLANAAQQNRSGTTTMSDRDRLAREARMVSEARGALHRGEPETALRIVRAARSQAGARLVPEELTVEAQACRAMGDETGAQRAEAELAGKFPEQAIAH